MKRRKMDLLAELRRFDAHTLGEFYTRMNLGDWPDEFPDSKPELWDDDRL